MKSTKKKPVASKKKLARKPRTRFKPGKQLAARKPRGS